MMDTKISCSRHAEMPAHQLLSSSTRERIREIGPLRSQARAKKDASSIVIEPDRAMEPLANGSMDRMSRQMLIDVTDQGRTSSLSSFASGNVYFWNSCKVQDRSMKLTYELQHARCSQSTRPSLHHCAHFIYYSSSKPIHQDETLGCCFLRCRPPLGRRCLRPVGIVPAKGDDDRPSRRRGDHGRQRCPRRDGRPLRNCGGCRDPHRPSQ